MHLVDFHVGNLGVESGVDVSAVFLNFELEGVYDVLYQLVGVHFLQFEGGFLTVEHRHLEHLLYLEA